MPKIIENPQQRLMDEARRQIEASGYGAMTIRSVAKGCGIGIGTVYNYFASKEELVARFLLEDWEQCIGAIQAVSEEARDPRAVAECMYEQLLLFSEKHRKVFRDEAAASGFAGSVSRYHGLLRSQLAQPLARFCGSEFAGEFIAEALLTWTMEGRPFEEIYGMVGKLL